MALRHFSLFHRHFGTQMKAFQKLFVISMGIYITLFRTYFDLGSARCSLWKTFTDMN